MSIYVVTAKHPKTGDPTDWYFDDGTEAARAHMYAKAKQHDATIRDDYISDFVEFENWIEGRA